MAMTAYAREHPDEPDARNQFKLNLSCGDSTKPRWKLQPMAGGFPRTVHPTVAINLQVESPCRQCMCTPMRAASVCDLKELVVQSERIAQVIRAFTDTLQSHQHFARDAA